MISDPRKQLAITLTEPVVFLRSSDPSGRPRPDANDPPTLVRGVLNLNVVKPIGISSIEVELTGVLTLKPPDDIGSRRVDLPDYQKIYSSTVTVFRADQVVHRRRPASGAPGFKLSGAHYDDHARTTLFRPSLISRRRSEQRSSASVPPDLGPSPPYTPVAQSPTPTQSRLSVSVESPARILDEPRQATRDDSNGQACQHGFIPPSSRPHSSIFPPPNHTTRSNASPALNDSLHPENDNHTDDTAPTSPSCESDASFHDTTEEHPHIPPHRGFSPSLPSCATSVENTGETQPRLDSSNTVARHSHLHLSLSSVLDAFLDVTSRTTSSKSRGVSRSEERERGRTRIRDPTQEQRNADLFEVGGSVAGTGNGSQLGANASHSNGHIDHREHHLLGLGRVLGLEHDHEVEKDGEQMSKGRAGSWREFQPGTHSFPISFLLPPNLPPTLDVPHGSLHYAIKAIAHRPGTFTPRLSCQVPLLVVAVPTGESSRASGLLLVQKQWEGKLEYTFGLSSRLFLIGSRRYLEMATSEGSRSNTGPLADFGVEARTGAGYGTAVLDLTLLPLEKIKIWRLDVIIDERIMYVDKRGRLFRDDKKQVKLLELRDTCSMEEMNLVDEEEQAHKNKRKNKHDSTQIPLLPTPISPHRSPLLRYIPPSTDPSILAGPGPYTLSANIGLPDCDDPSGGDHGLHFTAKQEGSCPRVEHSLRLLMRVECVGDEGINDHEQSDKKKLFDISVQAPITILSCRCVPESQTLPAYSQITEDNVEDRAACACQSSVMGPVERRHEHQVGNRLGHIPTSNPMSSPMSEDGAGHLGFHRHADEQQHNGPAYERSRSPSRTRRSDLLSPFTTSLHSHPHSPTSLPPTSATSFGHAQTQSHGQHHHSRSQSYTVSTSYVRTRSHSPVSTPHTSRSPSPLVRYERLVSGLESEAGDVPPSYESIASDF